MAENEPIATARLIADIGGTNARFALTGEDGRPTDVQKLAVADYPGPVEAARAYLAGRAVREAVLAVATPVTSDRIALTNSPWAFSIRESQAALGLDRLEVINDFTAQALAVPWLTAAERRQIGGGAPVPGQVIGIIGAGTGLGVGGLVPVGDRWQPLPGEGGHVSFAPRDEVEAAILLQLQKRFGHVSTERLLSGPGLVNLAVALAALEGETLEIDDPHAVVERAETGTCRFCHAALELFSALLGAAAGDLALTLGARGGIYIGGGLAKRLGALFDEARFRAGFVAKGRLAYFLEPIPTYLITRSDPGLLGAAALAAAV
jgi:glucokinase